VQPPYELVEEYDLKTDELMVRKRRSKTVLGKDSEWEFLVGEAPRMFSADTVGGGGGVQAESS
jgi:hypothetical protein